MTSYVKYVLAAIISCAAASAAATPIITYDFTGTVASVSDNDNFKLNGSIPVGTNVTGSFSYDAGATGTSLDPTTTRYPGAVTSFSVNIGGGLLIWSPTSLNFFGPFVTVRDNDPTFGDVFATVGGETPPTATLPAGATTSTPFALVGTFVLEDLTATALTSQNIPTTLNLSDFGIHTFELDGGLPVGSDLLIFPGTIIANVQSLTFRSSVPEPATVALLGIGLAGLGLSRRRKE